MSDDLVERVARAFCASDGADPCEVVCDWCLHRAGPVVAVCMEEAAKVADGVGQQPPTDNFMHDTGWDGASLVIAAAIRAMIKEPQR